MFQKQNIIVYIEKFLYNSFFRHELKNSEILIRSHSVELLSINSKCVLREFESRFGIFCNWAHIEYLCGLTSSQCWQINNSEYILHVVQTLKNMEKDLYLKDENIGVSSITNPNQSFKKRPPSIRAEHSSESFVFDLRRMQGDILSRDEV